MKNILILFIISTQGKVQSHQDAEGYIEWKKNENIIK